MIVADFLVESYLWIKIFHILAIISWMAGLFYLPRLFVYHADVAVGSETSELFKIMERRLLKAIMRPAALASVLSGLLLLWILAVPLSSVWILGKLLAVAGMLAVHGMLEVSVKCFARDERPHSSRYYRVFNEVPTVLLIFIVGFVILKP